MRPTRIKFRVLLSILFFSTIIPLQSVSAPKNSVELPRPKIGLVLSGGGALGLAHIGVLKALEELLIPVDCVVGSSMGALVGGIYASGMSPRQIEELIINTDLQSFFDDQPPRAKIPQYIKRDDFRPLFEIIIGHNRTGFHLSSGGSAGYKFELFIREIIGLSASISDLNFDDLPTPYRATATNLENGDLKIFSHGDLAKVMRASMSLPAVIAPVELDGVTYIDGGFVRNLPLTAGRALCGDIIIAVNLGTRPKKISEIRDFLDVAAQSYIILTEQNVQASLDKMTADDILLVPDLKGFDSSSFSRQQEIIDRGVAVVQANKTRLSKLSLNQPEYQTWLASRESRTLPPLNITSITGNLSAKSNENINNKSIMSDITTRPGKEFNVETLTKDISHIYGRGDFSYVGYTTISDDKNAATTPGGENAAIVINTVRKPWGPGYLKLGVGLVTDFDSTTHFDLAASYRQTWMNSLGAEWRTDFQWGYRSFITTEFIQPLQGRDGFFMTPYAGYRNDIVQFYKDDKRAGEFDVSRAFTGLFVGVTSNLGELKIGPYLSNISAKPDFGLLSSLVPSLIPEEKAKQKGLIFRGVYDQLDNLDFPHSGLLATANVTSAQSKWGSEDDFTMAQITIRAAKSFGKHTLVGQFEWGSEIDDTEKLPIYEYFSLGGPMRVSGLKLDQLTGPQYSLVVLSYYNQFATLPTQLGRGVYYGMSIDQGKMEDNLLEHNPIYSASIFWAADTVLGPLYFSYGYASSHQDAFYLTLSAPHYLR